MANLKCPNPSCPYVFDPSGVPAGAVLACPRCGMRFTLGPQAPPASAAHYQGGQAPTTTMPPGAISGAGLGTATSEPPSTKGRAIARKPSPGTRPQKQSYQMMIMVGIAVILIVGAGATIALRLTSTSKKSESGSYVKGMNLAFEPPPSPWAPDEDYRAMIGGSIYLVFKRPEPDAFMVFGGQDYSEREARNSELELGINKVLTKLFEPETLTKTDISQGKWLGKNATFAFSFRGQDRKSGENVVGQAYAVGDRGVGYWTLAWAPETSFDKVAPEFETIRNAFRFADPNRIWKPKKSNISDIKGDKFAYTLQDPDDIWKESRTQLAADEDPLADVKRVASIKRSDGSDGKYNADLVTFVIDPTSDPIDDAKLYLERLINKDAAIFGKTELIPVESDPAGSGSANAVEKHTEVVRLRTKNGNVSYLVVLSAIKAENKVVFVRCQCPWDERDVFEPNFIATTGSLRAGR